MDQFSSPSLKFQFGSQSMTGSQVQTAISCPACLAAAVISCNGTNLYHEILDIDVGLLQYLIIKTQTKISILKMYEEIFFIECRHAIAIAMDRYLSNFSK